MCMCDSEENNVFMVIVLDIPSRTVPGINCLTSIENMD